MAKRAIILILSGLLLAPLMPVAAIAPDLTNMGRLLAFNRRSVQFLDICISNLPRPDGPDANLFREDIEKGFEEALKKDFNAHIWYLQGNYSRTYLSLVDSQNQIQELYRRVLENYIDETWILLEESAPLIVRVRDRDARHLLKLGYRDLESARLFHQRGYNIKPTLHTNQVQWYTEGIKRIRRARRFGILALIEAKLPPADKEKFQVQDLNDFRRQEEEGNIFRQSNFVRIANRLTNLVGRQLLPPSIGATRGGKKVDLILLEMHQDNYARMISDRRSVWQRIMATMQSDEDFTIKRLPDTTPGSDVNIPENINLPDR